MLTRHCGSFLILFITLASSHTLAFTAEPLIPSFDAQHRGIKIHGPAAEYMDSVKFFDCGNNLSHASPHLLSTIHNLHAADLAGAKAGSGAALATRATTSTINVPVYLHIVTTTANKNMVTPLQATQQFNMLNASYAPYGVRFTLTGTTWTVNDTWATASSSSADAAMKAALRQGSYGALNLYFQSDMPVGNLGHCTMPTLVGNNPYPWDGCNIALGTMPGGPIQGYNMGKTAVHETGHWLGLFHTFEGYSCTGNGDFVADTPSESQSTNGCPTNPWKNTCSNRVGADPIHNFMDYSTDACYERFTPGQQNRIHALWGQYRQSK